MSRAWRSGRVCRADAVGAIGRSIIALVLMTLLFGAAPSVRAATVICPEAPLLSEEIARAGSVFVGQVRRYPEEDPGAVAGAVAVVVVEEIWRGPDLAPVVRVSNPVYAGAPTVELTTGWVYLFLAEFADARGAAPVEELVLRECGLSRPFSPELAGLRPADARVMPGFGTVAVEGEGVPRWPWVVVGLLLLAAAGAYARRQRMGTVGRWLPWATAGTAAAVAVVSIGLMLTGAGEPTAGAPSSSPAASASASRAPEESGTGAVSPGASQPPTADDPALVVRISEGGAIGTFGRFLSIHADGRVIGPTSADTVVQRWLSPQAVARIREAIDASQQFGPDAPATATHVAVLRAGAEGPQRGAFGARLVVGRGDANVSVEWTPIPEQEADLWEPAPEIARLDELAELLWTLHEWLPEDGWLQRDAVPYQALRFRLADEETIMVGSRPPVALSELEWPLATPMQDLPASRTPSGLLTRCVALTRAEATQVVGMLSRALDDPALALAGRLMVELAGDVAGRVHRLTVEPLMPDEAGCPATSAAPNEPPVLAPGAIALVRVDGLRVRDGPDTSASAIDSFRAGERVAVVAEVTAENGTRWLRVRQGPGDRQGWVSAGPADGDPWLVAVGNGAIAFMAGSDPVRTGIMDADGGAVVTLADAAGAGWSPDGKRLLLSIGPYGAESDAEIAVVNSDGSGLRRLAVGGDEPVWSPDGTRFAFVRWEAAGPAVFIVAADGTSEERVAPGWWPAWSPDGTRLAIWRHVGQRPPGDGVVPVPEALWIVDLASGDERQITPGGVDTQSMRPAWSPDGGLIAVVDRLLRPDGTEVRRLETGAVWADQPWSPDGEDLAFVEPTPDGTGARVALLSVDTGEVRTVVPAGDADPMHVSWSPDGRYLAFATVRWTADGADFASLRILTVPATGGKAVPIGPEGSQRPMWQPIVSHGLD